MPWFLSGPSHDVLGADVYYHQFYENKASTDDCLNFEKETVVGLFNSFINVEIIEEKNVYLLNE